MSRGLLVRGVMMRFFTTVFRFLFDHDEFMWERERRKYHEAIARGEDPPMPTLFCGGNGKVRVDPSDIILSKKVQKQVAGARAIERKMRQW